MNRYVRYLTGLRNVRFVRDVLTIQAGTSVYMAATFASSIVFARVLGVEGYGLYAVILAFVGTVHTFINLGQGPSLLVFFAEQHGKKDRKGMSAVLRNFIQGSIFNTCVLAILAFFAPALSLWLYGRSDIGEYARILFIFQACDIWNSMCLILLQALRRIRPKVLLEQGQNLSAVIFAMLSLWMGYGILGIVLSQLIVSLIFLPLNFGTLRFIAKSEGLPSIRDLVRLPMRATLPYFLQGLLISIDKNIGNFFPQGLFFLLSLIATPAIVGIARIAVQLSTLPKTVLLPQVVDLSTTVLANMRSRGIPFLRKNAIRIVKHAFAFHVLMSVGAMIVYPFLIPIVYGKEYLAAIPLTLLLIPLNLPNSLCVTNSPLLRLFRKIHYSIIQTVATWILMIAILLWGFVLFDPILAFAVAYGLGQLMPATLTVYLFGSLLKEKRSVSP